VALHEHPAYSDYMARYKHLTVNHSIEFSTDDGVNNNQAESFFARMRRMVIGQAHRVTPKYMYEYMSEIAWREDNRRAPPFAQSRDIMKWISRLTPDASSWKGYWQGKRRQDEVLFVP
jgi:ISXO2-like transposase domain